ncbi:MAG: LytR/AlgR family response regulator transcription factor [Moorellales bacterium]
MPLRIMIVDDNPGARAVLRRCVRELPEVEVVGEATGGQETLIKAREVRPNVILLDIDMPDTDGLSVARQLVEEHPELYLVFVTAYPEYALEAFQVYAYDYIVKPIDEERVRRTLRRLQQQQQAVASDLNLGEMVAALHRPNRLVVRNGRELVFIDPDRVIFVAREGRKTVIYTRDGRYETTETLAEIEQRLDPHTFFRSHKSYVVNLNLVERLVPWTNGSYLIKFRDSRHEAVLSRHQARVLVERSRP